MNAMIPFLPLVLILCGFASDPQSPIPATPAIPAAEPLDFSFTDLAGTSHVLSEMRGKPVLLEFWASWCIPCRKGVPFLDRLLERRGDSIGILAVTLETDDEAVSRFVAEHPGRFLVGRDPTGRAGEIFEVAAMPTALLLDARGRILARFEGGGDSVHERIEKAVEDAIRGIESVPGAEARGRRGPKGNLKAWERGYLADPIMSLDGDPLTRVLREHIHASKEAAAGDGGVAGGGCGCN